jgi:hypothetical protein
VNRRRATLRLVDQAPWPRLVRTWKTMQRGEEGKALQKYL